MYWLTLVRLRISKLTVTIAPTISLRSFASRPFSDPVQVVVSLFKGRKEA